MIMTDDSWYVVRNTRGVTGFVGPGSKPVPLTDEEAYSMGIAETPVNIDIEIGESIKVVGGPLENQIAVVTEINIEKKRIKGLVNMFGRETPVELNFNQVQKLE
jgi:transcriptional antiterminator NusG